MDLMWVMGWSWAELRATPVSVVEKALERMPTYARVLAGGAGR